MAKYNIKYRRGDSPVLWSLIAIGMSDVIDHIHNSIMTRGYTLISVTKVN